MFWKKHYKVIDNGTWVVVHNRVKHVLKAWSRRFQREGLFDAFDEKYTSDGAIGDAYETTCTRLALGRKWTCYWNLIEYAFYVYDAWCLDEDTAKKNLAKARTWKLPPQGSDGGAENREIEDKLQEATAV